MSDGEDDADEVSSERREAVLQLISLLQQAGISTARASKYSHRMVRLGYDQVDFVLSLSAAQRRTFASEIGLSTADAIKMERHVATEQIARHSASAGKAAEQLARSGASAAASAVQLLLEAFKACISSVRV